PGSVFHSVALSAPSALMKLFLEAQQELLTKDYVGVTLSPRHAGAAAVIQRFNGEVSSIPWLAVLDDAGKLVASTTTSKTSTPPGTTPVAELLKATAQKLTHNEIQELVKA